MSGTLTEDQEARQAYSDTAPAQSPQQAMPTPPVPPRTPPPPPRKDDPNAPITMYSAPASIPDTGSAAGKTSWGDYAKVVWQSTLGMGEAGLGAASLVARKIGASPDAVQHIEEVRKSAADMIENSVQSMSPSAQYALHASIFGGQSDNGERAPTPGEVGWGRYLGLNAMELVPPVALALLTRGLSAKLGVGIAGALAATGGEFGAIQMGQAYGDLVKQVDATKPDDWKDSPAMQEMLQGGTSFDDAKKQIVEKVAGQLGALQFGIGAVTGAGAGGLMMRGPLGLAGKGLLARIGLSVSEGAATMATQTGGGEVANEAATNQAGLTTGFDPSKLARAFATGALQGGVLGGVTGAIHGREAAPAAAQTEASDHSNATLVNPDVGQALNTQLELPLTDATKPGFVGAQPQGEMFRTMEEANRAQPETQGWRPPPQQPTTQSAMSLDAGPGEVGGRPQGELFRTEQDANSSPAQPEPRDVGGTVSVGRASDGMKVGDLRDALKTMPNQDPKALARMSKTDLAVAYDKAVAPGGGDRGQGAVAPSTPEPAHDMQAQAAAVGNPGNPKDAMFVADGSPMPQTPPGAQVVPVSGGRVITTNKATANSLRAGKVDDAGLAKILGYPETKDAAIQSGNPTVVQGRDAHGNVVHESLASPGGVPAAAQAAAERTPAGGSVAHMTPEEAQARRSANAPTVVDEAAHRAQEPTPGQAEAGNYQKGHVNVGGLDISVETPKGGVRRGTGPDGRAWEATMPGHYGYIKRTTGADGDHVDVTLGPKAHDAENHQVYVIDQKDPATGKFDEHKSFVGYDNAVSAIADYDRSFSDGSGPSRRGAANAMTFAEFKEWAKNGDTKAPITYKAVSPAAAKRAAEKARMAATGPRVRGEVATVELPEGKAPTREPMSRDEALNKVEEGVRGFKLQPLHKGADIEKAVNQVVRELSEKLSGTKTDGDVAEVVAKWARSKADPIPGTRTRRIEIGDQVMRLLQNKSVDEYSGRDAAARSEARSESRSQATVMESEGTAREIAREESHARDQDREVTTQDRASEPGEESDRPGNEATTVVDAETPLEGDESVATQKIEGKVQPEPQKIVDKLPYWLDMVRQGHMTPDEAALKYGAASGTGRPRQFKTFGDYLDHQIAHAEDPKVAELLKQKLMQQDKLPTSQAKSAATVKLNAELERTGKAYADEMRKLREELDPVKAAADAVDPPAPTKRPADILRERLAERKSHGQKGWDTQTTEATYSTVLHDPRVNRAVDNMLHDEQPHTLHDYLDAISKDEVVRSETPEMAALARRMMELANKDVTVTKNENATGYAGLFHPMSTPGLGAIEVNPLGSHSSVETVLHEGLHSITSHYLETISANHPDMLALKAMGDELRRVGGSLSDELRYALSSPHELHTMLMTNPEVQRLAAATRPSFGFQGQMRALGYGLQAAKSVWSAFTAFIRRALGLRGVATPEQASVMDHILRPLQDITDRAAAFNRNPPFDINYVAEHALKSFKDTKDDVIAHVDPAGLGDKARKVLLGGSTTDALVDRYKTLVPAIENVRAANEAIAARGKDFHDAYADKVKDWTDKLQGPDRDKVASLLVDASTADVRLGRNVDNSHLTTVGQRAAKDALQVRYDALPAAAKRAYDESHALQDAMYKEEREARLTGTLKGLMPDATKDQVDELRGVANSKKATLAYLADPDNSSLAAKFGQEWASARKLVSGIVKIHDMGIVQGDYFPLRREGDYLIHYGEKGTDSYGVEMFDRVSAAEVRREELAKQGAEPSQVLSKRTNQLRDMINAPAIDEITSAMKRRGDDGAHIDAMQDLLSSIVMQHATHSEGARMRLRRQGVKGASKDVEMVVAKDFLSAAARVGYVEHGAARSQALQAMQDHTDYLGRNGGAGDQRIAQAVTTEMQKRMPTGDDAQSLVSSMLRKATPFGYIQSLMSPSHMLTSTIEAHMNSTAFLGARHGVVQSNVALGKALKDATPVLGRGVRNVVASMTKGLKAADWNLSTVVRDALVKSGSNAGHMTKLFNALNASGLIDHTFVRELQRIADPRTELTKGWWGKFMDLNAAGAHAVDVYNKSAIAKAAFDLELRKSGDVDTAVKYATDIARKVMPNYNLGNKSRISTSQGALGGLAAPITQFKQYGIHMYSMMAGLVHSWQHGASPGERREARNAFAAILATHAVMAGSLTLLGDGLRWVGGAYDFITGADKPHDYENDVRRVIADWFGPELGEVISRGIPHLAGIDIHRRVGLANLLEPPELKSFDKKGFAEAVASAMTGAAGEDAAQLAGGLKKMLGGDITGGLKDMVPRIIRDPMKAVGLATRGVTDSKGRTVLPADKISGGDVARQALGFQPSQVSEFREGRYAVMEARDEAKSQHSHLMTEWVQADPDDRSEIMTHIRAFNQANPGQAINLSQLLQAQKRARDQAKQANSASMGLTLPRGARSRLSAEGAFANIR